MSTGRERLQLIEQTRRGLLDSALRAEDQGNGRANTSTAGATGAGAGAAAAGDGANVNIHDDRREGGLGDRADVAADEELLSGAVRRGHFTSPAAVAVGRNFSAATTKSAAATSPSAGLARPASSTDAVIASTDPIDRGPAVVASRPIADGRPGETEPIRIGGPAAAATATAAGGDGGVELTPIGQNLGVPMRAPAPSPPSPPSPPGGLDKGETSSADGAATVEVAGATAPSRLGASVTPARKPSASTGSPAHEDGGSGTGAVAGDGRSASERQGAEEALWWRGAGREPGDDVGDRQGSAGIEPRASRSVGEVRVPRVQQVLYCLYCMISFWGGQWGTEWVGQGG